MPNCGDLLFVSNFYLVQYVVLYASNVEAEEREVAALTIFIDRLELGLLERFPSFEQTG